jgi:hypothetical protein
MDRRSNFSGVVASVSYLLIAAVSDVTPARAPLAVRLNPRLGSVPSSLSLLLLGSKSGDFGFYPLRHMFLALNFKSLDDGRALGMFVADLFNSRSRLEAENLFLRQQLTIAMRRAPPRLRLRGSDRAVLIGMTRLWPNLRGIGWFSRRLSCGGIVRASKSSGVGNLKTGQGGRKLITACVTLSSG